MGLVILGVCGFAVLWVIGKLTGPGNEWNSADWQDESQRLFDLGDYNGAAHAGQQAQLLAIREAAAGHFYE